jgi:hypothetical protein
MNSLISVKPKTGFQRFSRLQHTVETIQEVSRLRIKKDGLFAGRRIYLANFCIDQNLNLKCGRSIAGQGVPPRARHCS